MPLRVLITGDAGFIGLRLRHRLEASGYLVAGFDRLRGEDLLEEQALARAVLGADIVFHVAAEADLTRMARSLEHGRAGVLDNVAGTHNLACACARHRTWLIHVSTFCVYGEGTGEPASEDGTLPRPPELYASSKYASEAIVAGYGQSFDMPWTILRIATAYGPQMRPALGLHVFLEQALCGSPLTVHGDGSQVRALTYVDDIVVGFEKVLTNPDSVRGEIINLGSAHVISALQMAEDVRRITRSSSKIVRVPQRKHQTMLENVDVSKAARLLGWRAETDWLEGLEHTYAWMLKNTGV